MFAVIWAWIQNTWFASAYDNDDWIYRLLTMVQMIGLLVLALGLP
jgi:low temperature requirement protein LtrA